MTLVMSFAFSKWEWDTSNYYLICRALSILVFLGASFVFFCTRGSLDESYISVHAQDYSLSFAYFVGIYVFSCSQPSLVPTMVSQSAHDHRSSFKIPLGISMVLVTLSLQYLTGTFDQTLFRTFGCGSL
jgi:hypothetical protein